MLGADGRGRPGCRRLRRGGRAVRWRAGDRSRAGGVGEHRAGGAFTSKTENALKALQRRKGVHVTGALALDDAVFLPEAVRIAKVTGQLGGSAQPGAQALNATSDTLHVQVNLDPSEQGQV